MKRLLAIVLSVCLTLSCLPVNAIALGTEQQTEPQVALQSEEETQALAEVPEQAEKTAPVVNESAHADHGACICAVKDSTCSHTALTWTAWESETELPTEAGNYYLTKKVTLAAVTTISANVKICLNGFDVDLNQKRITVDGGDLTVMNCQAELNAKNQLTSTAGRVYNGRKTGNSTAGIGYMGGAIGTNGPLTLIAIHLDNNQCDHESDARSGGAIYANYTTVTLESCSFKDNYSMGTGGVFASYGGSLTVKDCLFTNNHAIKRGGAIAVNTSGASGATNLTITGNNEFTGNKVTSTGTTVYYGCGGAIFAFKNGTTALNVTIEGNTKITGNSASQEGGGVCVRNKSADSATNLNISGNVQISGNTGVDDFDNLYFDNSAANSAQKVNVGTLGVNAEVYVNVSTAVDDPDAILALAGGATLSESVTTGIYVEDKAVAYNATDLFYYPGHAHQACVCAISGNECSSHGGAPIWTAWEKKDSLPTDAGYYYLTDNVELTGKVAINGKVNLCLNGFNVDLNETYIEVSATDDLTVLNCKAALKANGQLDEANSLGGKLTNGKNTHGAVGYVAVGGKLTTIGVEFYKNVNYRSGTIYDGQGGGAFHVEGQLEAYACRFVENTTNNHGGAIALYANGSVLVDDCYFSGNTAAKNGGALSVFSGSATTASPTITITGDTEITGNTATNNGGAIYTYRNSATNAAYTARLVISDRTKITGNTAKIGGGVYMNAKGTTVEVSGNVQITGNTGSTKAPNVYLWDKDTHKVVVGDLGSNASIGIFTGDNFTAADPDEFVALASGVSMSDTENTGLFFEKTDPANVIGYNSTDNFYFVTEPPKPHEHGACICAVTGATCSHTALTWTAWESTTTLPTEAGNYYLTGNVTLADTATVAAEVKICLNGFNIDLNDKKIVNTGDLTVMNCQAQLNSKKQLTSTAGKIHNGASPNDDSKSGIYYQGGAIGTSGPLTLIAVHLNDNFCYQSSDARSGGAIYAERTTVTVESCSFSGNEAKGSGGVIATYAGTLTVKDSLFKNNKAAKRGGAICINSNTATAATNVNISGNSEFTGNEVTSTATTVFYGCGGAIFVYKNGTTYEVSVTIGGNTIVSGNSASQEGGGICLRNSDGTKPMQFTLQDNVQIYGNSAADPTHNIYFENSSQKVKIGNLGENAQVYISTKTEVTDPDDFLAAADGVTPAVTEDTRVVYDNNGQTVGYNESDKFYFVAPPAPAHKHGDCICTITGATCSHTQLTWTVWESTTTLPTDAGNYYLSGDVTLAAITDISADVKICLNGFNINLSGKKIHNTGSLTVMNCQAELNNKNQLTSTTGKIYGGDGTSYSSQSYGGAISTFGQLKLIGVLFSDNVAKGADARTGGALYVDDNGSAVIESCKFYNNQALSSSSTNKNNGVGGAISVYKGGSLDITDTVFENNIADLYGGAICVNNRYSTKTATVTIDGNCSFTGNKTNSTTDGYGAALFLYSRSEETAGKLTVTLGGNTEITGNTAGKYGAVLLRTNTAAANALDITVSDNLKVHGNSASNDYRANLYFYDDNRTMNVGQLGSGAMIYASTQTEVADPDAFLVSGASLQATEDTGIYYDRVDPAKTVGYSTDASEKFYFVDTTVYEHDDHGVCSCAITEATCSHSVLTWKPWTSETTLPTDAGNYFLTRNVTLEAAVSISDNVNICLNSYDIDLNQKKIANTGVLSIVNCQAELNEKNQLTSENGKIHNGKYGTSGTDVKMYGGAIGTSGDLTLIGVLFTDNLAKGADARTGGALYVEGGMTTIESCKFEDNQALSNNSTNANNGVGGAISVYKGGSLDIADTVFKNNTADLWGGAICVNNRYSAVDATVDIRGNCEFTGNKANSVSDGYGAAVYLYARSEDGGSLTVNISGNCKITDNTSTKDGAVYLKTHANASKPISVTVGDNVQIFGNTGVNKMYADLTFYDLSQKLQVGQIGEELKINIGTKNAVIDPDEFMEVAQNVTLQDMEVTGFHYTNTDPATNIGYSTDPSIRFYFTVTGVEPHDEHPACDCFLSGDSCSDAQVKWLPWIYDDQLPTTSGNYYLTSDIKVADLAGGSDGDYEIANGQNVRLCLNGHNIVFNENNTEKSNYCVKAGGSLTVMNCKAKLNAEGFLDAKKSEGGKLTGGKALKGGTINSYGELKLIGVWFTGNEAHPADILGQGGGALYIQNGVATIQYCELSGNSTPMYGGGLTLYRNGKLTIENTVIANNEAKYGGGICVYNNNETKSDNLVLKITNSKITGNTVEKSGGGVYVQRHSNAPQGITPKLTINDSVISGNTSVENGGGISITNPGEQIRMDMTRTEISGNTTKGGGGMYIEHTKLVGTTVTIANNKAKDAGSAGGGIYAMASEITLQTKSLVTGNSTEKGGGGGIHCSNASTINLYNCTISKNESPDGGGVRLWRNSVLNMKGGIITENRSTAGGGGMSMVKGSVLNLESGEISKNTCEKNGGGIYADNYYQTTDTETYELPKLNLTGGKISENATPGSYGGGIYAKNCQTELSGTKITKNTGEKANGGGIYVSKVDAEVEVEVDGELQKQIVEFEPTFTMTGGEVSGNQAKNAGGIYFNDVDATISGGSIKSNKATENAGGISVRTAKLTFKGDALISGNTGKSGGGVILQVDSSMDMTGGTVEKNSAHQGGGFLLWSRSVLNMKGGSIKSNKATKGSGGGIYAQGGAHVKISGGSVSYNTVTSNGGGIYATKNDGYNTRVTVSGGSITGNYAKNSGGGAYTNKGAVANIYGGSWKSNEVKVCGGAIYANASDLYLYGGTFTKNHAEDCGGAINTKACKILLDGAVITENISDARGGGLRIYNDCEFIMKSGEVSNNEAARGGGGIALYNCKSVDIEGGKITGNKVLGSELYPNPIGGGGINVYEGSNVYSQLAFTINISGGEISNNYSLTNGGGIVLNGRTVMNITGGKITDNTAEQLGGAVIVDTYYNPRAPRATLNVTGGEISGNSATDGGAIYARNCGEVNLDGATIEGNTASGTGGALYLGKGTKASLTDSLLTKNTAAEASGFYAIDDFQMHNLEVTKNNSKTGYAAYIDAGEFDGRSYVLSIIKMSGDIRITGNNGGKGDLFIGENAKINVAKEGLGKNTLINLELETGVLTNTIIGAYNYEGGDRIYTVTYGDRSLTDLEPILTEASEPAVEETEPVTEPVAEPEQEKDNSIVLPIALGAAALAVVLIVLILLLKRKKSGGKRA